MPIKFVAREKTSPVQNMHLGFTEMHVLNRPIFCFHLRSLLRLCKGLNHMGAAHRAFAALFLSFVVPVLGHGGSKIFSE